MVRLHFDHRIDAFRHVDPLGWALEQIDRLPRLLRLIVLDAYEVADEGREPTAEQIREVLRRYAFALCTAEFTREPLPPEEAVFALCGYHADTDGRGHVVGAGTRIRHDRPDVRPDPFAGYGLVERCKEIRRALVREMLVAEQAWARVRVH